MSQATVIFFNGASSAGKSSIIKALKIADTKRNWLSTGTDEIIQMSPSRCIGFEPTAKDGWLFKTEEDPDGNPVVKIQVGPFAWQMYLIGAQIAKSCATIGKYLLIDEILLEHYDKEILRIYQKALAGFDVYFVGIKCSLERMLEREKLRGNRSIGLARAQYLSVHQEPRFYDLEIDTTNATPFDCANQIIQLVENNPPKGFSKLGTVL